MAKRYSGDVTINLYYSGAEGVYNVRVSRPDGVYACAVGTPAHLTTAVDSPEAYDSAARAALSFAEREGLPIGDYAARSYAGTWYVGRSKAKCWPDWAHRAVVSRLHNVAGGNEFIRIVKGLADVAERHRTTRGATIAADLYLGREWLRALRSVHELMNGPCGTLDRGEMSSVINEVARVAGFKGGLAE